MSTYRRVPLHGGPLALNRPQEAAAPPFPGGSSGSLSVTTLLKNMIGAGIFSLPIGLRMASPVPGIVILASIGMMSAVSFWMVGYCCLAWGVSSFRKLWHKTLGASTAWIIDVTILVNGYFTLVSYLVLIGDFTTKSFGGLLGEAHLLARSRGLNQWAVTCALLLPLSLTQDLRRLAFTSVLGLAVIVYVVLFVLRDSWLHSPAEWGEGMPMIELRSEVFEGIALYTQAFVAHYNAPKLFGELERPTNLRWLCVVAVAYTIAFLIYASFALAGLRRFQEDIKGNVLKNFDSNVSVLVAWLGMGFSIAFTYPIIFNSTREACVNLISPVKETLLASPRLQRLMASPRARFNFGGERNLSLYSILGPRPQKSSPSRNTTITVVIVLLTAVMAAVVSDVGLVNALAGSIMGCMVAFVFPSLLFFHTVRAQLRTSGAGRSLERPLLERPDTPQVQAPSAPEPVLKLAASVAVVVMASGICFSLLGTIVAVRNAA